MGAMSCARIRAIERFQARPQRLGAVGEQAVPARIPAVQEHHFVDPVDQRSFVGKVAKQQRLANAEVGGKRAGAAIKTKLREIGDRPFEDLLLARSRHQALGAAWDGRGLAWLSQVVGRHPPG